jgi:hypothetical protein
MTRMGKGFKKFKSLWLCTATEPLLLLTQKGTQKLQHKKEEKIVVLFSSFTFCFVLFDYFDVKR